MYLKASLFLDAPSSFARALGNGVKNLERTDKLLSIISNFYEESNLYIDEIVQFNNKLKDIKN
jgi:Holliday junction resolvasome RuvABC ATP-dependent DNA helicase subunit